MSRLLKRNYYILLKFSNLSFFFLFFRMNNTLPFKFIDELFRYLNRNDPIGLARLLKIKNEQFRNVYFKGIKYIAL